MSALLSEAFQCFGDSALGDWLWQNFLPAGIFFLFVLYLYANGDRGSRK